MAKSPRNTQHNYAKQPQHSAMANLSPVEEAELVVRIAELECERAIDRIRNNANDAIDRMHRAIREIEQSKAQLIVCASEGLASGATIEDIESEQERRAIYLTTTITETLLTAVSNAGLARSARDTVEILRANQKRTAARARLLEVRSAHDVPTVSEPANTRKIAITVCATCGALHGTSHNPGCAYFGDGSLFCRECGGSGADTHDVRCENFGK